MTETIVQTAKVFSDVNRVRIAALLQREGALCVCAVCDTLSLSQPLVSRHLKQMREAGVVTVTQRGKWSLYSIDTTHALYDLCRALLDEVASQLPQTVECARLSHGS